MSKPGDYSSQSYSPGTSGPTKSYPPNKTVDSSGKSREKDDMVGLNDKFVKLIDKVKDLEDEKRKLETKLKILKEKEDYDGKINDLVKQLENQMEEKIESLLLDKEKLQADLQKSQEEVQDTKKRYKDELQKKADVEMEFVIKKPEADGGHIGVVNLALDLEDLEEKLDFLRVGYDEEIKELESQVQNQTVVLPANSKRSLDIDDIVEGVKKQYADVAARTREEAEQWNQKKMNDMVVDVGQREQEVRNLKRESSDLVRQIQRLNGDMEALIRKEDSLKKEITNVRREGDENLGKAQEDMTQIEAALRRAKQDLAGQVREHQALMNLKLALDIEIATYRKLLEGEEQRMNHLVRFADAHLPLKPKAREPTVSPSTTFILPDAIILPMFPDSKRRLLIRVEVEAGKVISESSHYTED